MITPCPHCRKDVELTRENADKDVLCPHCSLSFRMPPVPAPNPSDVTVNVWIGARTPKEQTEFLTGILVCGGVAGALFIGGFILLTFLTLIIKARDAVLQ